MEEQIKYPVYDKMTQCPKGQICLNKNFVIITILLILGLIVLGSFQSPHHDLFSMKKNINSNKMDNYYYLDNDSNQNSILTPNLEGGSQLNNKPDPVNFNRPNSGDYNRPNSGDYNRPNSGDYNRPDQVNFARSNSIDYNRPNSIDYNRPNSIDYNRPDSVNFNRPDSVNYNRPISCKKSEYPLTPQLNEPQDNPFGIGSSDYINKPPLREPNKINIPTRGYVPEFKQVGILHNKNKRFNNKNLILPLFGKPLYPGSSKWQYYSQTDSFASIKIDIKFKGKNGMSEHGCEEISDGDTVRIPAYAQPFRVNLYNIDKPTYIPYIV